VFSDLFRFGISVYCQFSPLAMCLPVCARPYPLPNPASAPLNQVPVPSSCHSSCALIMYVGLCVCAYVRTCENVIEVININK